MRNIVYFFTVLILTLQVRAQLPDCTSTDFYLIGSGGSNWGSVILKFNLDSPTGPVSYNGSTADGSINSPTPYMSHINLPQGGSTVGLAIADFGDGNLFYASYLNFSSEEYGVDKFNGAVWEHFVANAFSHQLGGNGEYLYLQSHRIEGMVERDRIDFYDGIQLTTVWESQGESDRLMSADITVDDNGNAYFFTGPEGGGMSDTLHIMKSDGQIIAEMPIEIASSSSAGSFFMYDTLYLYSGIDVFLLPVHISASGATAGNPISVPDLYIATGPNGNTYFHGIDAATCASANIQLSVNEFINQKKSTIFPNPVKDNLTFESKKIIEEIEIYNITGQKMFSQKINTANGTINMQFLIPGTYIVRLVLENKQIETFKIIKN